MHTKVYAERTMGSKEAGREAVPSKLRKKKTPGNLTRGHGLKTDSLPCAGKASIVQWVLVTLNIQYRPEDRVKDIQ